MPNPSQARGHNKENNASFPRSEWLRTAARVRASYELVSRNEHSAWPGSRCRWTHLGKSQIEERRLGLVLATQVQGRRSKKRARTGSEERAGTLRPPVAVHGPIEHEQERGGWNWQSRKTVRDAKTASGWETRRGKYRTSIYTVN